MIHVRPFPFLPCFLLVDGTAAHKAMLLGGKGLALAFPVVLPRADGQSYGGHRRRRVPQGADKWSAGCHDVKPTSFRHAYGSQDHLLYLHMAWFEWIGANRTLDLLIFSCLICIY